MAQNQLKGVAAFAATRQDMFAPGYFASLMLQGIKPDQGWPVNHLPEICGDAKMEMVLGLPE